MSESVMPGPELMLPLDLTKPACSLITCFQTSKERVSIINRCEGRARPPLLALDGHATTPIVASEAEPKLGGVSISCGIKMSGGGRFQQSIRIGAFRGALAIKGANFRKVPWFYGVANGAFCNAKLVETKDHLNLEPVGKVQIARQ